MLGPADVLALDQYQEQLPLSTLPQQSEAAATPVGKRGRKRKVPLNEASLDDGSIVLRDGAAQPDASLPTDQLLQGDASYQPGPLQTTVGELPLPYVAEAIEPNALAPTIGYSGMTPVGMHGDYDPSMTPHHHGIDQLESIPNLPADQVSSILNGTGMDGYGYDDGHQDGGMSERIGNDWNDDYDFPQSVGPHVRIFYQCFIAQYYFHLFTWF